MAVDHYENFPVASVLMPARLRPAVVALYRFARSADDIADEGDADAATRLAALDDYTRALRNLEARQLPVDQASALAPVFYPLAQVVRDYALPVAPMHALLSAFSQDVVKTRYADFATLKDYCARSADPVGELMLHLYGAATPQNLAESSAICTGLQLVNFWQDVAIDWDKQRVYLPQEDLARFGVSESDIAAQQVDDRWRALMQFEVSRARALLHCGAPLARRLPGRIGWELRLVVMGGLRILHRIERADYDVFRARPTLGPRDWAWIIWHAWRWLPARPLTDAPETFKTPQP
ncbi:squalene synthase HpnC [Pigmentiphaga aceris]|uniref:Squalene synthase HpnC n=1 Tax=Pigmentiphaga aceris TaxID=1940612 RepID=A0A5C0AYY8_9BURK|nr:squalene synthase HpnC [Pigmentiphaga aceris]QEI06060.1 squalene synthase HpnC [Pigmentiphaga aceris]